MTLTDTVSAKANIVKIIVNIGKHIIDKTIKVGIIF